MVNKKSSPTLLRVHEVDFGSKVPIDDDKLKTFCGSRIFGSGSQLAFGFPTISDVSVLSRYIVLHA